MTHRMRRDYHARLQPVACCDSIDGLLTLSRHGRRLRGSEMETATYGFGASATLHPAAIASMAATCETLGYDSFWLNVAGALQGARRPNSGVPAGAPEWQAVGAQHPVDML